MFGIFYKPEKINNVETLVGYPAVLISTRQIGHEENLGMNYCKVLTGSASDQILPISRIITSSNDKCTCAFLHATTLDLSTL
jgi:NADH:ubiquinone oxidoreductase subunit F (NADH-binding)